MTKATEHVDLSESTDVKDQQRVKRVNSAIPMMLVPAWAKCVTLGKMSEEPKFPVSSCGPWRGELPSPWVAVLAVFSWSLHTGASQAARVG